MNEEGIRINVDSNGGELNMKEVDKWAITTVTQEEDRDGIKDCQQYHVQVGLVNVVFNPGWEIKTVGKITRKG